MGYANRPAKVSSKGKTFPPGKAPSKGQTNSPAKVPWKRNLYPPTAEVQSKKQTYLASGQGPIKEEEREDISACQLRHNGIIAGPVLDSTIPVHVGNPPLIVQNWASTKFLGEIAIMSYFARFLQ